MVSHFHSVFNQIQNTHAVSSWSTMQFWYYYLFTIYLSADLTTFLFLLTVDVATENVEKDNTDYLSYISLFPCFKCNHILFCFANVSTVSIRILFIVLFPISVFFYCPIRLLCDDELDLLVIAKFLVLCYCWRYRIHIYGIDRCVWDVEMLRGRQWKLLLLHWRFSDELEWRERVLWEKEFNAANHHRWTHRQRVSAVH